MKILIVEDDTLLLQGLILAAQTEGYACDGVTTARMAEQSLEAGHYSLVVLDLGLPDEDGLHFLARIRQKKYTLPVLILTARDTLTDKIAGLDVGADDYLVKPFTYERFQQALDTFCRHRDAVAGDAVEQSALDRLFSPALPAEHQPPKGLQESTLELVRACLRAAPPQGLPSEALSRQTGLSVVTVRRYVNYLVERGEAASAVNYDTGGRPCRLYRCPGPPA